MKLKLGTNFLRLKSWLQRGWRCRHSTSITAGNPRQSPHSFFSGMELNVLPFLAKFLIVKTKSQMLGHVLVDKEQSRQQQLQEIQVQLWVVWVSFVERKRHKQVIMPEKREWNQADRMQRKKQRAQEWEHYLEKNNLSLINTNKEHTNVQSQRKLWAELDVLVSDHPGMLLLSLL